MAREIFVVVHGEAFIPEAFGTMGEAQEFMEDLEDCHSGPWTVIVPEQEGDEGHSRCAECLRPKDELHKPQCGKNVLDAHTVVQEDCVFLFHITGYYRDNDQPYADSTWAKTPEAAAALKAWECAEDNGGHASLTVVEVRDATNEVCCDLGDRNSNTDFDFNTEEDECPVNDDGELIE
jgi:hypothetical protein